MSLSAITISVKVMHALKNGSLLMSLMILNARSVTHLCIRFTALLAYHLRDQDSIVRTIDERHASEQDLY